MFRKSLLTLMLGGALAALSVLPAFANTWVIDPTPYENETSNKEWLQAEAMAELHQWANARKADMLAISGDVARYTAITDSVCDFLQYDIAYMQSSMSSVLDNGKGVCSDYTALTKALCDAVGIPCKVVTGISGTTKHAWVEVTLNGVNYYSDPTQVDAGRDGYELSTNLWEGYIVGAEFDDLRGALPSLDDCAGIPVPGVSGMTPKEAAASGENPIGGYDASLDDATPYDEIPEILAIFGSAEEFNKMSEQVTPEYFKEKYGNAAASLQEKIDASSAETLVTSAVDAVNGSYRIVNFVLNEQDSSKIILSSYQYTTRMMTDLWDRGYCFLSVNKLMLVQTVLRNNGISSQLKFLSGEVEYYETLPTTLEVHTDKGTFWVFPGGASEACVVTTERPSDITERLLCDLNNGNMKYYVD